MISKPDSCKPCPLYTAPGPVWGVGPPDPTFAYVAQNPGTHEVGLCHCHPGAREPLIGPSGNIFNRQLFESGVRRERVFITNQVKCLTPDNREPTANEISCCRPLIAAELARLRCDTVVLSGAIAFRENVGSFSSISPAYKPTTSIFERMGCVEQRAGKKWIGTIHPAFVMRMPEWRDSGVDHLRKAQLVSGLELAKPTIVEHPTDAQVLNLVDYIMLEGREFAHDVETIGLEDVDEDDYVGADFQLTMCGVGGRPREALILAPEQVHLLAPIFADPLIQRYEHNGPYDSYHEEKILGAENIRAKPFDTMLGTHYLRSHRPKKLKPYVLSQYTTLPYYNRSKRDAKVPGLNIVNERLYNGMDVITTFLAAKEIKRQLVKWELLKVFEEFGQPLLPILEEMRRRGVRVDLRKALLFKRITQQKIAKCDELIARTVGPLFNPNSPLQVKEMLYGRLKLPIQHDPRTKKVTTNFEARKRLRWWIESSPERQVTHKVAYILLNLLDFKAGEKKKLEYFDRITGDGRIHAFYKAHGEKPFRLSSSPNLQNWPVYDISAWGGARRDDNESAEHPLDMAEEKEERAAPSVDSSTPRLGSLRSLVIADSDEDLLLTCDFEQLQLWIYAKQFNVKWLLDIFKSGEYIYGVVYERLYKEPFFQAGKPKTKKYRLPISEQRMRRAKAVPLGFLFGRSADAVATEYGWPSTEGHQLRKWWYGLNPELEASYSQIKYQMHQKGWIRHCFGQVIHYPDLKLTEAINSHAQSPEAFIVNGSIIKIDHEFKRRGFANTRILLQVHDSLTFNIGGGRTHPERVVEVAEEIVFPILGRPHPQLDGFEFRYSAEVSTMWDWDVTNYWDWKAANVLSRGDVSKSVQSA